MKEYFYTFWLSITPILELRASIPVGHLHYKLPLYDVILISSIGGLLVTACMLLALPIVVNLTRKHCPPLDKLLHKIFEKTRKKHSKKMQTVGELFLIIFVAIPIPGSGVFSGSLLAYLFGVKFWKAFILIGLGMIGSALIIALLTISGQSLWEFLSEAVVVAPE